MNYHKATKYLIKNAKEYFEKISNDVIWSNSIKWIKKLRNF